MEIAATASNPHPDDEYNTQRKPDNYDNWSDKFQDIWDFFADIFKGQKRPLLDLSLKEIAQGADVSPRHVRRFLEMLNTPGDSTNNLPLALKVPRFHQGDHNLYKIRWDFSKKRKENPGDPEPCTHRSEARNGGGGQISHTLLQKKKDKNTRDSKGVYDPINWPQMMYKLREKLQSKQLAAVIGKFIKQRNYHKDQPSRIRYFWTQLTQFVQKIRRMEFLSLREAYHDIMELLHKIMFIDYNTARERNRFPWEQRNWNEGSTSKIGDLIQQSDNSESRKKSYEEQLEEENKFEKKRRQKIKRLKQWEAKRTT